jgi:uncharacterized protein (DUF697 family)
METKEMTSDQREKCHVIIHGAAASTAAVGAGLAQLPLSDSAIILPIQMGMVVALGAVFDKHVTDSAAKGAILGLAAGHVGRAVSQILFGWIPVLGNAINASTAAGLTEAMGWTIADKFSRGEL